MNISFWDCKFGGSDNYEEFETDEGYEGSYTCTNTKGCGSCDLDNKRNDKEEFCSIAEVYQDIT